MILEALTLTEDFLRDLFIYYSSFVSLKFSTQISCINIFTIVSPVIIFICYTVFNTMTQATIIPDVTAENANIIRMSNDRF